ncbi:T9SS type A sorting domain-containing protein [Rhodocaloribacter litoris]|uniref:T9SS type A sorting domain-containing protein n=1 Tax=Rhodocaloribacter litoris TaxID=2558931 RepID=UPI001E5A74EF|nr:T9SS type A sorting domain-containing protein [Rhodocaloribacter litoris]
MYRRAMPYGLGLMLIGWLLSAAVSPAQTPSWSVEPSRFQSSMSLTGVVEQDGRRLGAAGDLLAAFVGEEVRGVAGPVTVGSDVLFFLAVYANADGEAVTFRFYEASTGLIHDIAETQVFETNAVRGLVSAPLVWTTGAAGGPAWQVDPAPFAASMNVTGTFVVGERRPGSGALVAAFAGEEVRGVTGSVDVGGTPLFFLTVYANGPGETLTFRIFDPFTGRVHEAAETLAFEANGVVGSVTSPFVWHADTATHAAHEDAPAAFHLEAPYPNPFGTAIRIPYVLDAPSPVRLTVYDLLGRVVARLVEGMQAAGPHEAVLAGAGLPDGLYLVRLEAGDRVTTRTVTRLAGSRKP